MHVRKFEADTLDEAIKAVKFELGPEAIILKTITNKGIKGAFKKKIEITAAISEEEYVKKARVDQVLNNDQKKKLYQSSSKNISETIDNYHQANPVNNDGYGKIGLNKAPLRANMKSEQNVEMEQNLDHFLSDNHQSKKSVLSKMTQFFDDQNDDDVEMSRDTSANELRHTQNKDSLEALQTLVRKQQQAILKLEEKMDELVSYGSLKNGEAQYSLQHLRETLRALDLDEPIILRIIKRAQFELSEIEMRDEEKLYGLAMREMKSLVVVKAALFSRTNLKNSPVITFLVSDTSTGQTSLTTKLAVMAQNSCIIRLTNQAESEALPSDKMLKLDVSYAQKSSEIMAICRKKVEQGVNVFIDYKINEYSEDDFKTLSLALRRSFENVEILATISAIQSELYNKKIISKYAKLIDGLNINHTDLCLNFATILNIHFSFNSLPIVFLGTGPKVPSDIEEADVDKIISKIIS